MKHLNGPNIAQAMKKLRAQKNMSQGDIVRATGFERSFVSRLESGKIKYPRLDTVHKISKTFGMTITEFIDFVLHL